jgi:uncharacterized protein YbjT (DUF2867 family)
MRVAVVGATGNVGTSLLQSLAREPAVDSVLGLARRLPELQFEKTDWASADVVVDDLVPFIRGVDVWSERPGLSRIELIGGASKPGIGELSGAV